MKTLLATLIRFSAACSASHSVVGYLLPFRSVKRRPADSSTCNMVQMVNGQQMRLWVWTAAVTYACISAAQQEYSPPRCMTSRTQMIHLTMWCWASSGPEESSHAQSVTPLCFTNSNTWMAVRIIWKHSGRCLSYAIGLLLCYRQQHNSMPSLQLPVVE